MTKKTVLIIDKDEKHAKCAHDFFAGCEEFSVIGIAQRGDEGLDMAKKHLPDIVIMGLLLDNIDGLNLIAELAKLVFSPIIIVCSTLANEAFIKQAVSSGASHYFVKPVTPEEIRQKNLRNPCGGRAAGVQDKKIFG